MKTRKVLALLLAIVLCMSLLAITAFAENAQAEGVELTLTTDKTEYAAADKIVATVQVKNASEAAIENLKLTLTGPSGYVAAGEESKTIASLNAGASDSLEVSYAAKGAPNTGDSILLVALAAVFSAACMLLLMRNRRAAAMALAVVMILGVAVIGLPTSASAADKALEVSTTVKVDGKDVTIKASVSWGVTQPVDPPAETVDLLTVKSADALSSLVLRSDGTYKVEGNFMGFIPYSFESTYTVSEGVVKPVNPGPNFTALETSFPTSPVVEAAEGGYKFSVGSNNGEDFVLAEFIITDAMMDAVVKGEVYEQEPEENPEPAGDLTLTSVCGTATAVIRKDGTYKIEGNYLTFVPYSIESTYTVSGGVIVPANPGPTVSTLFGDLPSYPKIVADGDNYKLVIDSENSDGALVLAEFVITAAQMAELAK